MSFSDNFSASSYSCNKLLSKKSCTSTVAALLSVVRINSRNWSGLCVGGWNWLGVRVKSRSWLDFSTLIGIDLFFALVVEIDLVFVGGRRNRLTVSRGEKDHFDFSVGASINLVLVWVVKVDIISVWEIETDLISVQGSDLPSFQCRHRTRLVTVYRQKYLMIVSGLALTCFLCRGIHFYLISDWGSQFTWFQCWGRH